MPIFNFNDMLTVGNHIIGVMPLLPELVVQVDSPLTGVSPLNLFCVQSLQSKSNHSPRGLDDPVTL